MSCPAPGWITSSFGHAADTSPAELSELGAHLRSCHGTSGRLFALQCGVEAVRRFVAGHLVTTLVVAVLVIGAAASVL